MILKNESGREFFVRKYKVRKKDEHHLFVGEVEHDGRISGITVFPMEKSLKINANKILHKRTTAPSPASSSVGAGLADPGPATPSKDIIPQPGIIVQAESSPILSAQPSETTVYKGAVKKEGGFEGEPRGGDPSLCNISEMCKIRSCRSLFREGKDCFLLGMV